MILRVTVGIVSIVTLFTGCSKIPTHKERVRTALSVLSDKSILQKNIQTSSFPLFTLQKIPNTCKDMKVYIEGDGLAWVTRRRISDDPTPLNPLTLSLMNVDDSSCKVYIARPCQYIKQDSCEKKYWTSDRFSAKIIQSFNEALDNLKVNHKNSSFTLVGYSGGGAVATLLSAKRDDVSTLITVAGNLDTDAWVKLHHISALSGSLNPANYTDTLAKIPQYHLIGKRDKIIPKDIFLSYKSRFQNKFNSKKNIHYRLYDASHTKNWKEQYTHFLQTVNFD